MLFKYNMFMFPFAGGSNYSFREFVKKAPNNINIIPVELPGRGSRIKEALLTDIHEIVQDVYKQIQNYLDEPYVFYGHSMGTIIGYLVTKLLQKYNLNLPMYLFLSGAGGPSLESISKDERSALPRDEFIGMLRDLGGCPEDILSNDNLMDFFEPILRADFKCIEKYEYENSEPLDVPILVVIGDKEETTNEAAAEWKKVTTFPIEIIEMKGSHFFIFNNEENLLQLFNERIKSVLKNERQQVFKT